MSTSEDTPSTEESIEEIDTFFTDMAVREFDADGRDSIVADDTYTSEDGDRGADDVDARRLHRTPSISELRYYSREGPFGTPIIEKPIVDAFKHGFTVKNDYTRTFVQDFLENEYLPVYKTGQIKARRDGFAVIKMDLVNGGPTWEAPTSGASFDGFSLLTLDDLEGDTSFPPTEVLEREDLEPWQVEVTDHGCVVVDDISSNRHEEHLGYMLDADGYPTVEHGFLHKSRCQHLAWNEHVDGDFKSKKFGHVEGDSVLSSVIHVLKAIQKGNWGMGQALFRYSAPLYAAHTPAEYGEEEFEKVVAQMDNLNMRSSVVMPPATELKSHDGASDFDPSPFYSVLIDNVCAGTLLTQSVLLGSEAGSVGASEADLKNYFTAVETLRHGRLEDDMREMVEMVSRIDPSVIPTFSLAFEIEWEPLFKVEQLDRAQGLARIIETASNGVNNYILTPEEARSFLENEWVKMDHDVEFDDLTESDWDDFDRVTTSKTGQHIAENEPDVSMSGNPSVGNTNTSGEGGVERGSTQNNTDPTASN